MANDKKLSGGVIPGPAPREGGEYDKFVQDNIDKAIIGTPVGDGGVRPLDNTNLAPNPNVLELPASLSPSQQLAMQQAFKAIIEGKNVTANAPTPVATPPRDMIVPDNQTRSWNPMQEFRPTAKLSDMEASAAGRDANPNSVITHARPITNLNPKEGCSPVLIDCFDTLTALVKGRWMLPGAPSVETLLVRLRREIEDK